MSGLEIEAGAVAAPASYTLGIDFGSLSARCVVVDVATGREVGEGSSVYAHGILSEALPSGIPLPAQWALQLPGDYREALFAAIRAALADGGVDAGRVVGIGLDATACTILPVAADGTPLAELPGYRDRPHAYLKMWKHVAAQSEADEINELGEARNEAFLARHGGRISSEWMFPKLLQTLREDPELYAAAASFVEVSDWLVWVLTGRQVRSKVSVGMKSMWSPATGFPAPDFFAALDERFEEVVSEKLWQPLLGKGELVGGLTPAAAERTGLAAGVPVVTADLDGTCSPLGAGITRSGQMLVVVGTSALHLVLGEEIRDVPGMCAILQDIILPGRIGYEAGQPCVGDVLQWFVDTRLPASYLAAARDRGLAPLEYLSALATEIPPGSTGLIALDWWNGNRSTLMDAELTSVVVGETIRTRPEEVFLSFLEATAFGTRLIVETMRARGVAVEEFFFSGGIAMKNPLMMQIYADVLRQPITIVDTTQLPAHSMAVWASLGAGSQGGGYDAYEEAAEAMAARAATTYQPDPQRSAVYDQLFAEYRKLYELFSAQDSAVKTLARIRRSVSRETD